MTRRPSWLVKHGEEIVTPGVVRIQVMYETALNQVLLRDIKST